MKFNTFDKLRASTNWFILSDAERKVLSYAEGVTHSLWSYLDMYSHGIHAIALSVPDTLNQEYSLLKSEWDSLAHSTVLWARMKHTYLSLFDIYVDDIASFYKDPKNHHLAEIKLQQKIAKEIIRLHFREWINKYNSFIRKIGDEKRRLRNLQRIKDSIKHQASHVLVETPILIDQVDWSNTSIDLKLGKINTRLMNIQWSLHQSSSGKIKSFREELLWILDSIALVSKNHEISDELKVSIVALIQQINELLDILYNIWENVGSSEQKWANDDVANIQVSCNQKTALDVWVIDSAKMLITQFRLHIHNPSSTCHTKTWSKWDGSLWFRWMAPMLDYLEQKISTWHINPSNFSWFQVAKLHYEEVLINNINDDLSVLRTYMMTFVDNHSLWENLQRMSTILSTMVGKWRFRDPSNLSILIDKISKFNPPPLR